MAATLMSLMAGFQTTDQKIGCATGFQLGCNPQFVRSNEVERLLGLAVDLFVVMDLPQMAWAASETASAELVALQGWPCGPCRLGDCWSHGCPQPAEPEGY